MYYVFSGIEIGTGMEIASSTKFKDEQTSHFTHACIPEIDGA